MQMLHILFHYKAYKNYLAKMLMIFSFRRQLSICFDFGHKITYI